MTERAQIPWWAAASLQTRAPATCGDNVHHWKTPNARVVPRPERVHASVASNPRYVARFGAGQAIALLVLELGAAGCVDDFDIEWFEGEFLYRLGERLFAEPEFTAYRTCFVHLANTCQTETIDVDAVLAVGKRRYYRLLFATLKSIYTEERIGGSITAAALRTFRFTEKQWDDAK